MDKIESKYLPRFIGVDSNMLPAVTGNRMVVEVLPKEEIKSAAGLILATVSTHKSDIEWLRPKICVVLMKGGGVVGDGGILEPIPFEVGSVCLVSEHAPKYLSVFPGLEGTTTDEIALVSRHDVHLNWSSIEEYVAYLEVMRSK